MDRNKSKEIVGLLHEMHPDAKCELDFNSPFELLVAVILSAQCTDKRVNEVTDVLFTRYNTPIQFAEISIEELEELIHSCGFYHNKAKAIKSAARAIVEDYNGEVPNTIEELMKLDGVGRKTANVVASNVYGIPAIAVDTHCFRVARRLGISSANTPEKVEQDLCGFFDKEDWSIVHHLLIFHGRYTCESRRPKCELCSLRSFCKEYNKT